MVLFIVKAPYESSPLLVDVSDEEDDERLIRQEVYMYIYEAYYDKLVIEI
jgi:hypothetical protein